MLDITGDNLKIHGFMIQDLNLRSSELIIYALIYSYHEQDTEMVMNLDKLSLWTNISKHQVKGVLWQLQERGLIIINEIEFKGEKIYTLDII